MNLVDKNRSNVISILRAMEKKLDEEWFWYSRGIKYGGMEIGGRKLEDVEPDHRRARAAGIALRLVREQIDRLLV